MKNAIGYKFKENCKEYREAALKMCDSIRFFNEEIDFCYNSPAKEKLQKAGVLDLWFDVVYEKPREYDRLKNENEKLKAENAFFKGKELLCFGNCNNYFKVKKEIEEEKIKEVVKVLDWVMDNKMDMSIRFSRDKDGKYDKTWGYKGTTCISSFSLYNKFKEES